MAFEIPVHLKKEPSSAPPANASAAAATSSSAGPAASGSASEHIRSLLAPLLAEDWPALTPSAVGAHRQRLELDAQATKTAVLKLIRDNYAAVGSQLNGNLESESRTAELKRKLGALEDDVEGSDKSLSLVPPLITALQAHSGLAHRLALGQQQLALAELLAEYRSTFAPLADGAGGRPAPLDPLKAVGVWAACRRLLERPEWAWGGSGDGGPLEMLKADLGKRLRVVRDRIEEELGALFDGLVSASWDPAERKAVVSVRRPASEGDGPATTTTTADRLVSALSELGTLNGRTQTLVGRLVNDLFRPAFASAATAKPGFSSFARSTSADGSLALFHLVQTEDDGRPPPASTADRAWRTEPSLLPALESLLDFLSMALPPLPTPGSNPPTAAASPSPSTKDLAALLVPKLIPLLVSDLLAPSLRTIVNEPASLPVFSKSAEAYADWERQATSGRSTELGSFAARVGPTWVRLRRADVLARARELVGGTIEGEERDDSWLERGRRNGWASWTWERETVLEPPAPAGPAEVAEPVAVHSEVVGESAPIVPEPPPAVDGADAGDDDWAFDDPIDVAGPSSPRQAATAPVAPPIEMAVAEDDGADDSWGFDEDDAPPAVPAALLALDDGDAEPDAWGFSGSDDDESRPIVLGKGAGQPREAKRLGKAKAKVGGGATSSGFGGAPPPPGPTATAGSRSSSLSRIDTDGADSSSANASRTGSPGPAVRKGAMKLGKKTLNVPTVQPHDDEAHVAAMEIDERPSTPMDQPAPNAGPRTIVDRLRLSERVKPLFDLSRAVANDVKPLQSLSVDRVPAGTSIEAPSALLQGVVPDVFSLYRALLPVAHQATIGSGPALAMQAVNDCDWLATQAETLFGPNDGSANRLRQAGQRWFADEVARREAAVQLILDGAFGFVDVGDEQRGADSEGAVADAVARIEELSSSWKPVLPLDRTYAALGLVLDGALRRILREITDLDDITTAESQRLNEMLKLVHPLEALFVEESGAPSVVVHYVPSWLKFCYLSELLEASMADITYLFDSGALIDFEPDELARLVRALFSDNTLRAKTIDKIREGHPAV